MSIFKIQQIRSCTQCGDILAKKCTSCSKHPDRKPRIVEWYNLPRIIRQCECGCGVLISCQRDGCKGTRWLNKAATKNGTSRSESMFCSRRCNCLFQNSKVILRVDVPCAWCNAPVKRKPSELRPHAFCRPDHFQMWMAKRRHDAKEAVRVAVDAGNIGLLHCVRCNDVTEHETPKGQKAVCKTCQSARAVSTSSLDSGETARMKAAEKSLLATGGR